MGVGSGWGGGGEKGRREGVGVTPRVVPPRGENEQGNNRNKRCNVGARKREGISLLKSLDLRFEYPCIEVTEELCDVIWIYIK